MLHKLCFGFDLKLQAVLPELSEVKSSKIRNLCKKNRQAIFKNRQKILEVKVFKFKNLKKKIITHKHYTISKTSTLTVKIKKLSYTGMF